MSVSQIEMDEIKKQIEQDTATKFMFADTVRRMTLASVISVLEEPYPDAAGMVKKLVD